MLIDIVKKSWVNNIEFNSVKKSRNKIVEILAKSKIQNLLKSKFVNLFKFKKVQNNSDIKKPNFLSFSAKVIFNKLRQMFTLVWIL